MITKKDIQQAQKNNEFVYFYQPKVSVITGDIVGAEALVRWIKPDGKIILPDAFIPLAEKTGLIKDMTLQLFKKLEHSIHLIYEIKSLRLSFNITADDLKSDKLTKAIIGTLKAKRLIPDSIELEITESTLIKSNLSITDNLNRIADAGVGLAIDDFGTGYSSLSVLSDYPFSVIKLGSNLINGITNKHKNQFIAKTAIRMAHLLRMDIVAEGVENSQQYNLLQHMGCTILQGHLISKPLPFDEFIDFLQKDIRYPQNIAGTLHMILIDHILWYRDFVCYAASRLAKTNETFLSLPMLSPKQCTFGEYFNKEDNASLIESLSGEFVTKLQKLHLSLHDEAQIIIKKLKKEGKNINNFIDMSINFKKFHMEFITQLQELENFYICSNLTKLD